VLLGFCFVVTAFVGSVEKDDIDSFYSVYTTTPNTDGSLGLIVHVSEVGTIVPITECNRPLPEFKTQLAKDVYLTNWFGEQMHFILKGVEWTIGLFYEVHLPPSVKPLAELVRDPTFGTHPVDITIASASTRDLVREVDKTIS